jgi:hypothetical protein
MEAEETNWKSVYDSSVKLQEGEMYVIFVYDLSYHLTMFAGGKFHGKSKTYEVGEPSHFYHVPEVKL